MCRWLAVEADPPAAVARAVGFVEAPGRSRSLIHSVDISTWRQQCPDHSVQDEVRPFLPTVPSAAA